MTTITAGKKSTLGEPEAAVSFQGASKYVLIDSDIQKLDNGFADYSDMADFTTSSPSTAHKALAVKCGRLLQLAELRGLRQALRNYCDQLEPPSTGFTVTGNSTSCCLSEIAKILDIIAEPDDDEETPASKEQALRDVLEGLSGRMPVLDDGWLLAKTSAADATARRTKLINARKKANTASRKSIIAALLKQGHDAAFDVGLDNSTLTTICMAYVMHMSEEIDKPLPTTTTTSHCCGSLGCSQTSGLTHFSVDGEVDIYICDGHLPAIKIDLKERNPDWVLGTEDFCRAVGRLMSHQAKQTLRCRVCDQHVPTWGLGADLCCCDIHKKQMKTWVRAKSLVTDMDFDHADIGIFAKRAFISLRKTWDLQCSRCACCGKTGEDGANITYGYSDEASPNGERAMYCFCRAAFEDHLMETSPQKVFGRGSGTEQDEWDATLALASEIGRGKSAIRGWLPGTARIKKSGRTKASDFFPEKREKSELEVCADGKV